MNFLWHLYDTFSACWRPRLPERSAEEREIGEMIEVRIRHPRMTIKGIEIENKASDESNFPKFAAFFGIPYAQPPVGKLRFKPPQPFSSFRQPPKQKIFDFENFRCLQLISRRKLIGNEDCLYLNVYVPRNPNQILYKLPVLVYIHGGGFERGTGNISITIPDRILRKNLVFVTINYRLSIFGFLNMGTRTCRGNAGLKDQVQALKWIKANITEFGGDPNNVTISGHSAGGSCVNFHMISPLSKGLFHKAIVHAGGLYCPWGFRGTYSKFRSLYIGKSLRSVLAESMVSLMKSQSQTELFEVSYRLSRTKLEKEPYRIFVFLGPSVENIKKNAFIPFDIEDMKREAEAVPLMTGVCEGEGYSQILANGDLIPFGDWLKNDSRLESFLMGTFRWSEESARKHRNEIRKTYHLYPGSHHETILGRGIANFYTDVCFRRFYDNFKIGHPEKPFYVYEFCFITVRTAFRAILGDPSTVIRLEMPAHGDEYYYLYDPSCVMSEDFKPIINTLCSMLANFCRMEDSENNIVVNGVQWRPHSEESPCYLRIDETLVLKEGLMNEQRWKKLNAMVKSSLNDIESPSIIDRPVYYMYHDKSP